MDQIIYEFRLIYIVAASLPNLIKKPTAIFILMPPTLFFTAAPQPMQMPLPF